MQLTKYSRKLRFVWNHLLRSSAAAEEQEPVAAFANSDAGTIFEEDSVVTTYPDYRAFMMAKGNYKVDYNAWLMYALLYALGYAYVSNLFYYHV